MVSTLLGENGLLVAAAVVGENGQDTGHVTDLHHRMEGETVLAPVLSIVTA